MAADTKYIFQRGKIWWCAIEVPPSLRPLLGRRLGIIARRIEGMNLMDFLIPESSALEARSAAFSKRFRTFRVRGPVTLESRTQRI